MRERNAVVPAAHVLVLALGCSGAPVEPAPRPAPPVQPPAAAEPAPPPVAPPEPASAAPSATAAVEAPAPPSAQGRCAAGMVEVDGGTFKSSYFKKEMSIEPFCLDENEVTTKEYASCVDSGACDKHLVHICDPSTFGIPGREDLPMVCVDFGQAERYCKAQKKRLPSDLEWEWAARGGAEGRLFTWGDEPPAEQLCWSGKSKRSLPCPVGSFPSGSTARGIHDLLGNVYEWTTTSNDASSTYRVGRGGSWRDAAPEIFKITKPGGFKSSYRCGFLGIRCATAVPAAG